MANTERSGKGNFYCGVTNNKDKSDVCNYLGDQKFFEKEVVIR